MKNLKIKTLTCLNDDILLTANRYEKEKSLEKNGLIVDVKEMDGNIKMYQTVLAVGPVVRSLSPGDTVMINYKNYVVPEHPEDVDSARELIKIRNTYTKVSFPVVEVDGKDCLLLHQRDILYKFTGQEEEQ